MSQVKYHWYDMSHSARGQVRFEFVDKFKRFQAVMKALWTVELN